MPLSAAARLKYLFKKVKNSFKESKRLTEEAAQEMDRRYPGGWAQNSEKMSELSAIKKQIKGRK